MFLQKLTVVAVFLIVSTQAEQTWYNLKTTWGPTPLQGFNDQPRTVDTITIVNAYNFPHYDRGTNEFKVSNKCQM